MYVLNRMQKKNNLMTKLTIVTSWKKTAQTKRETTRKSLLNTHFIWRFCQTHFHLHRVHYPPRSPIYF